jgi:ATP phosphoribosyltransferase
MNALDLRESVRGVMTRFWVWVVLPNAGSKRIVELHLEGEAAPIHVVIHESELSALVAQLVACTASRILVEDEDGYTHMIIPQRVTHFKFR